MVLMEWKKTIQAQGRIKIPQDYMEFKKLKEGDILTLIEKRNGLLIKIDKGVNK